MSRVGPALLAVVLAIFLPALASGAGIAVVETTARDEPTVDWGPTAEYLTRSLPGRAFEVVPLGVDQLDDAVSRNRVSFAITDPARYLELEERYGATRLLTTRTRWSGVTTREYGGVVFTRADRPDLTALDDLRGRSFVAVEPQSFGGWLVARYELALHGIGASDLQRLVFAGSPVGVVLLVRDGRADAGTVRTGTLERLIAAGTVAPGELRVLGAHEPSGRFPYVRSTALYPEWPIAALDAAPPDLARDVVVALLAMPPGAPAAAAAGIDGWSVPAGDAALRAAVATLEGGDPPRAAPGTSAGDWRYAAIGFAALLLLFAAVRRGQRDRRCAVALQHGLQREATLRRRVEEDLHDVVRATDDFFKRAPCGIHALDADGVFLEVNDPELALVGYTREDLVGRRRFADLLTPSGRQRFAREFPAFVKRGHVAELEFDLVRKDGTTVPVLLSATAVYDAQGRFVRSRSVVFVNRERTQLEDSLQRQYASLEERVRERTMELTAVIGTLQEEIRSRERAEELLRQSEQRALAIVEAVVDGIVTVDEDGFVESLNTAAERMFGWREAEVVGRTAATLMTMPDAGPAAESVGRRRDGTPFPLEVTVSEMKLGGRRVFLRVVRDLSESKRAAERLRQLGDEVRRNEVMATIGALVAGFAHEARNPLFGISAVVDALCARLGESADYREHVALLRRDVQRLSDLTRDLLEYGKPAPAALAPGDLSVVLRDAITRCRALAETKSVAIAAGLDPARCTVEHDDRLVRAFENLLQNAVQFAPPETTVRLEATRVGNGGGEWVECRIADRGPGIGEHDLPRLFEPFFTRRRGGTGLGLAIVRRIVEEHHGTVSAANDPHGGAVVTVRLPVTAEARKSEDQP